MSKTLRTRYRRPDIAWPTLCIFGIAILSSIFSVTLGTGLLVPIKAFDYCNGCGWIYHITSTLIGIFCFLLSTVCSYTQFTVAHDAVHRSVSKKYAKLNDLIGWIAQWWLGPTSTWEGLKYNHLEHHKHTNDERYDPDFWCSLDGPGGKKLVFLRWFFVDVSYFHFYYYKNVLSQNWSTIYQVLLKEISKYGIVMWLIYLGYFPFLLQYWILPSRVALFILAFAFDFLPHYPHKITKQEDKFKTTAYLYVPWILRPFLSLITFNQNHHIAHHLRPEIPFFWYSYVWEDIKNVCLSEGIIVRDILPKLIGEKIIKVLGDEEYHKLKIHTTDKLD